MKENLTGWVTTLFILFPMQVFAAAPGYIEYSGRLLDTNGIAVTKDMDLVVRIFDAPTAGNVLAESSFDRSGVYDGFFRVVLPFTPAQVPQIFAPGAEQYIELEVDGDVLSPRQRAVALAASFASANVSTTLNWNQVQNVPPTLSTVGGLLSCPNPTDLLSWSGSGWSCATDATAPLPFSSLSNLPAGLNVLASLNCSAGTVLEWHTNAWSCGADDTGIAPDWSRIDAPDLQQIGALTGPACRNGDVFKHYLNSWQCALDDTATSSGVSAVVTSAGSGLTGGGTGALTLAIDTATVVRRNTAGSSTAAVDDPAYVNSATLMISNSDSSATAWKSGIVGQATTNGGAKSGVAGYAAGSTSVGTAANIGVLARISESDTVNAAGLAAATNYGLRGEAAGGSFAAGVYGKASGGTHNEGIRGSNDTGGYAGYFNGDVQITGNLSVSGNFIRGGVRYYDVSPISFEALDNNGGVTNLRRTKADFIYLSSTGWAIAAVRLPHGTPITNMTCYLYDGSNSDQVFVELRRRDSVTGVESVIIAANTPTANSAQTYTLNAAPAAPTLVRNDLYSYSLRVRFTGAAGTALKYRSCVIAD